MVEIITTSNKGNVVVAELRGQYNQVAEKMLKADTLIKVNRNQTLKEI